MKSLQASGAHRTGSGGWDGRISLALLASKCTQEAVSGLHPSMDVLHRVCKAASAGWISLWVAFPAGRNQDQNPPSPYPLDRCACPQSSCQRSKKPKNVSIFHCGPPPLGSLP